MTLLQDHILHLLDTPNNVLPSQKISTLRGGTIKQVFYIPLWSVVSSFQKGGAFIRSQNRIPEGGHIIREVFFGIVLLIWDRFFISRSAFPPFPMRTVLSFMKMIGCIIWPPSSFFENVLEIPSRPDDGFASQQGLPPPTPMLRRALCLGAFAIAAAQTSSPSSTGVSHIPTEGGGIRVWIDFALTDRLQNCIFFPSTHIFHIEIARFLVDFFFSFFVGI